MYGVRCWDRLALLEDSSRTRYSLRERREWVGSRPTLRVGPAWPRRSSPRISRLDKWSDRSVYIRRVGLNVRKSTLVGKKAYRAPYPSSGCATLEFRFTVDRSTKERTGFAPIGELLPIEPTMLLVSRSIHCYGTPIYAVSAVLSGFLLVPLSTLAPIGKGVPRIPLRGNQCGRESRPASLGLSALSLQYHEPRQSCYCYRGTKGESCFVPLG